MKKSFLLICLFISLFFLTSCTTETRQDIVLNSIGEYGNKQLWPDGEFRDYIEFGVFSYSSVSFENNPYFTIVSNDDIEEIFKNVDEFEKQIEVIKNNNPQDELVLNYNFDRSILDDEDYFYIYSGENRYNFACIDLWIFDTQTSTLYYLHLNF